MFTAYLLLFFWTISCISCGLALFLMSILSNTNRTWTHLPSFCLHPYLSSWFLLYQSFTWYSLYSLFHLHIFLWMLVVNMDGFLLMMITVWHICAVYVLVISNRLWGQFWFWLGMYELLWLFRFFVRFCWVFKGFLYLRVGWIVFANWGILLEPGFRLDSILHQFEYK